MPGKDFFNFLQLWLSAHIKNIDRKYGEHAAQAGRANATFNEPGGSRAA